MQYIGSNIGINDDIIIDDINYEAIPGPSFTPGIGGTYKQEPPPFKQPANEAAQFDIIEPSQGCEYTLSAGDDTIGFCSAKTTTCELGRPYEPQRRIDPLRDPSNGPPTPVVNRVLKSSTDDILLKAVVAVFLVYVIIGRRSL